jgi:hypothetical protein
MELTLLPRKNGAIFLQKLMFGFLIFPNRMFNIESPEVKETEKGTKEE